MCALNKNVSEDPVRLGLVASFARPGGNATGINFFSGELVAKRLELLRELVPGAARVAVLVNPTNAGNTETTVRDVEAAARIMGLHIQVLHARTSSEINAAFTTFVRERPEPAVYASETFARNGGPIYYGTDWQNQFRQAAVYVDRILKGTNPGDLPVQQQTKFPLIVNLAAARALGIELPTSLLLSADRRAPGRPSLRLSGHFHV